MKKQLKYTIKIEKSALKSLENIYNPYQDRVIKAIKNLEDNPRPANCKKLSGRNAWRIRIGDYRIIYEIDDEKSIILIVTLGHRKNIYR